MKKDEPATKSDLQLVKADVQLVKTELQLELQAVRTELKLDIQRLDGRVSKVETDLHYLSVLFEDFGAKQDALIDIVKEMRDSMVLKAEAQELHGKQTIFAKALTATNKQVHSHERRITNLESTDGILSV